MKIKDSKTHQLWHEHPSKWLILLGSSPNKRKLEHELPVGNLQRGREERLDFHLATLDEVQERLQQQFRRF